MDYHGTGLIRDTHDARDYSFKSLEPRLTATQGWIAAVPTLVDLRRVVSPVRDQGLVGSCTGFALAVGLAEMLDLGLQNTVTPLAPLFVYYLERMVENTLGQDSGAQIRTGMQVLATYGVCTEQLWAYDPTKLNDKPSDEAVAEALDHRISAYFRINNFSELHRTIAYKNPVAMGIAVYDSFMSEAVAKTGIIPMPNPQIEQCAGGHAVIAVGYNDAKKVVICKNSWSPTWGDAGFFYLPYDYFNPDNQFVWDMWTASF